ncbi:MAG: Gx transporter family protein [Oscillospiraceae bacterium]
MNQNKKLSPAQKVSYTGLLFALACVLSLVENVITLPMMPGVKLGLANIVVMYAAFFLGRGQAFCLVILKSLFNLLTRGPVAGATSLCGGLFSLAIILLVAYLTKKKASYFILSILGAVFHNLGQLFVARIMLTNAVTWLYLPVLLISGIIMGSITSFSLKLVIPHLNKLGLTKAFISSKRHKDDVD